MPNTTMAAGKMNRRVTVMKIRENAVADASGHIDETLDTNWRIVRVDRKCAIVPANGTEIILGDQLQAQVTHRIEMRFDSESRTYTAGYRLKFGSRVFNLAGPGMNVNEDDVTLAFPAVEVPQQ